MQNKKPILVFFAFMGVLAAIIIIENCQPVLCTNARAHEWSRWEPGERQTGFGYFRQMRHCTNCNLLQIEYIK